MLGVACISSRMAWGAIIVLSLLSRTSADCAIQPVNGHVDIPSGETFIGDGAFKLCTSLTSVNIPNSVRDKYWC